MRKAAGARILWMPVWLCILGLLICAPIPKAIAAGEGDSFRGKISEVESTGLPVTQSDGYAMLIGVSRFKELTGWDLKYADDDAIEMAKFLLSDRSYTRYTPDRVYLLLDEKSIQDDAAAIKDLKVHTLAATHANLRDCWNQLIGKLQADPGRFYFTIYIAGHTVINAYGMPMYLTADAKSVGNDFAPGTTLSGGEIAEMSTATLQYAHGVMVIVDTCYSGKLVQIFNALTKFALSLNTKDQGNLVFFMSSSRDQNSRESATLGGGHGVFTYYMISGIESGAADRLKDNLVHLGELYRYVCDRVEESSSSTGQTQTPKLNVEADESMTVGRLTPGARDQSAATVRRQAGAAGDKPGTEDKPAGAGAATNPFNTGEVK